MQRAPSYPAVMGIINVSPDSFSEIGRIEDCTTLLSYAEQMVKEGVSIIDVGGEPTNPSLHPCVSLQEELDRVIPVLEMLCREVPVPISIDTSKPEVMREAIKIGVRMINDVRALRREGALDVVAASPDVALCLMHMSFPDGKPDHIEHDQFQPDIVTAIKDFLKERIDACLNAGIDRSRIIIDPGLGFGNFGKMTQHNLELLNRLGEFKKFKLPILIGASRKTFIGDLLNAPVSERLAGSVAAAAIAVYNGASIIRAHDVKATVEAVRIADAIMNL